MAAAGAAADMVPRRYPCPANLANRLLVVPSVELRQLPTGFAQRAKDEGACLIRKSSDRREIVAQALEPLDGGSARRSADLAADFLALGYCYLRSSCSRGRCGIPAISTRSISAIRRCGRPGRHDGRKPLAREETGGLFDVLAEEARPPPSGRCLLVDLKMLAPTTLGESLSEQLTVLPAT